MIILSETTDTLQVVLGGTVTANQLRCYVSWSVTGQRTAGKQPVALISGRTVTNTNNATDVTIAPAPANNTQRLIEFISVYNADTVNATVTVKIDANGTEYILWKGILGTGEMLQYANDGFKVITIAGAVKQAQMIGANNAVINVMNVVVLAEDVVNNNATLNTIADVTGLSFPVTAGELYWFEFTIPYTSAITTTGSRWAINGPGSPTLLNYRSEYTLTATTITVNSATAYDTPAASNASSLTAGNVATIWGFIKPSGNGSVTARFASEIANSAITAKAGATLRWMRVL